MYMCVLTPFNR